jgi:hypothetical protein
MRRVMLSLVVASGCLLHGSTAIADPVQTTPTTQPASETVASGDQGFYGAVTGADDPSVSVSYTNLVASDGAPAAREVAAVRARTCEMWAAPDGPGSMGSENRPLASVEGGLVDGAWYYQTCRYTDTGELASSRYWQYLEGAPGFGPDLAALAASAYDRIALPFPVPSTAPSLEVRPLTGLDTWLWIDPVAWEPREATAELAGFGVTVTATPVRVIWDMGEGERPVECDGPGTVWQPDGPESQTTDCAYNYRWNSNDEPDGVFRASVTVEWDVAWTASTGAGGTLAPGRRTTTFDVAVRSIEAQICYGNVCPDDD